MPSPGLIPLGQIKQEPGEPTPSRRRAKLKPDLKLKVNSQNSSCMFVMLCSLTELIYYISTAFTVLHISCLKEIGLWEGTEYLMPISLAFAFQLPN